MQIKLKNCQFWQTNIQPLYLKMKLLYLSLFALKTFASTGDDDEEYLWMDDMSEKEQATLTSIANQCDKTSSFLKSPLGLCVFSLYYQSTKLPTRTQ